MCKGSVVLDATQKSILKDKKHCCVPDFESLDIELNIIDLKQKVATDYRPIPTLFREQMAPLKSLEYADKLPTFHKVRDSLYKARQKSTHTQFDNFEDIAIPENLAKNFVCVQDTDILICVTSECKDWITGLKTYFLDGTFKSVPKPFIQLYTIHVDIGSDEEHTKVVPCVYALLPDKRQCTYERLFKAVEQNIPTFRPEFIKVDYEIGAINALRSIFPSAAISGCYFHYSQALYKNADIFGTTSSREGARHVAKCAALAHLPALKIHEGWMIISAASPQMSEITRFNEYMIKQWLKMDMVSIMTCYGHRHRTNNVVESWHKKMNNRIHNNANLLYFLSELRKEALDVNYINLQNEIRSDIFRKRNNKYLMMDNKIQSIVNNYLQGLSSLDKCITLLSILKYKI
ncbi:uncharacterized protein [Choristoneura fumiferana]|uniref:uncharacterized protein n=1 Tax=Choristoneura fumiferana TaxID=7141 RepID=UPI003D153E42